MRKLNITFNIPLSIKKAGRFIKNLPAKHQINIIFKMQFPEALVK